MLPPGCRFPHSVRELVIRRDDESVVLPPFPPDWFGFFASGLKTQADFMMEWECMPIQERMVRSPACYMRPRVGGFMTSVSFTRLSEPLPAWGSAQSGLLWKLPL